MIPRGIFKDKINRLVKFRLNRFLDHCKVRIGWGRGFFGLRYNFELIGATSAVAFVKLVGRDNVGAGFLPWFIIIAVYFMVLVIDVRDTLGHCGLRRDSVMAQSERQNNETPVRRNAHFILIEQYSYNTLHC